MSPSFLKALFLGELRHELLSPFPRLSGEQREVVDLFRESLQRFATASIDSRAIDREHSIPRTVIDGLAELGLFGMRVPEEYGGLGLDLSSYVRIGADLSMLDGAVAILSGGHSTIGIKALLLFGSAEQKARYLPRLATGELLAAFALSEPGAGSDAQALRTTATRTPDGRHYLLNGEKLWITNGGFADLVTVFARTPDHPRADGRPSISCFLVERAHGFTSGPEEDKLGIRGSSTVPLLFQDVKVPAENLVGEPGQGFRIALEVLNTGRTGLAGGCVGSCRFLLARMAEYVAERRQFGRPIGEFELVREKLGRCALDIHALECMTFLTTGLSDRGHEDLALEAAACKVFGTETLWRTVNDAMQCAGGNGFTTDYPYERMLRDARVNMIFEGTNEILRLMIAGNGIAEPGRRLAAAGPGAAGPAAATGDFGKRARGAEAPDPMPVPAPLRSEALALSLGTADLVQATTAALVAHGPALKDRQLVLAALADQAIALYGQAAVLARAKDVVASRGEEAAADELLLARGACRRLSALARSAVASLRDNDHDLLLGAADLARRHTGLPGDPA
ncbi:MAG TPA: acyl-CoA dehydrogenase family protein [Planctomycetota bacterium]|nr:acyl-CoA dehydrogenase family protein [Planctomycetota bacterium]